MKTLICLLVISIFISPAFFFFGCDKITDPMENTTDNQTAGQLLKKAYVPRPFDGTIIYTSSSQVNDSVSVYNGTGTITHLGICTVIDTTVHHYTSTGGLTVDGGDWITAANGAKVHMTWFMDYFDPSTWVWEIDGGTGRFEGATGSGPFTAEFTTTGDLMVRFTGTITY